MVNHELIKKTEWAFKQAKTLEQLGAMLDDYMRHYGIATYAFTYYSYHPRSINKLKYERSSPILKPWHDHYIAERYEEIDTTLRETYDMTTPQLWNLEDQYKHAGSSREKQMRKDSIDFGVTRGVSIPLHGPNNDFAVFLASQRIDEDWLDKNPAMKYELHVIGHLYYAAIRKLLVKTQREENKYELSKREMQCLTLVAQQYEVEQIAEKLSITPRTVHFHMQKINKKMGAKNKFQSVRKALDEGVLDL